MREVQRHHGDADTMALNVDDVLYCYYNPDKEDFGGLVRNCECFFEFALYRNVGISNVFHAEIKALFANRLQETVIFFRLFTCCAIGDYW